MLIERGFKGLKKSGYCAMELDLFRGRHLTKLKERSTVNIRKFKASCNWLKGALL